MQGKNVLAPFDSSLILDIHRLREGILSLNQCTIAVKVMLPTPSTSHVDSDCIYEPAEDSFLLLDTLSSPSERLFLTERFHSAVNQANQNTSSSPSPLILEVGTGSGVVLAFLVANAGEIFGRIDILTLGTDINPFACEATKQTVLKACKDISKSSQENLLYANSVSFLATLNTDLTASIRPNTVDVLIFNPPYVPTSELPKLPIDAFEPEQNSNESRRRSFESDSYLLSLSYAGGTDGMEVTNRLLKELPTIMNGVRGVAYILLCKQNKPDEVVERVRQWGPEWSAAIVGRSGKTAGWEKLEILRICRI